MAFPTVQTADTKNGVVTTNSASWTLTYPTNLQAGDLIIALVAADGDNGNGMQYPAGWTWRGDDNNNAALSWGKKTSDGTETGTFSVTHVGAEQGGWRVFRITGWGGASGSNSGSSSFFNNDVASYGDAQAISTAGVSANPNSPSLGPGWATGDTLWISAIGVDTSRTVSAYPTNCPNLRTADVSGGSGGATLAVAMANSATATFDPDAFTVSSSDDFAAVTIGIAPAAGGAPASVFAPYIGGGYYPT